MGTEVQSILPGVPPSAEAEPEAIGSGEMPLSVPEQHVLAVAFEEDLRARIQHRAWYRRQSAFFRPYLTDMERENTIALRALLKLRSSVRRASRTALRIEVQRTAAVDQGVERYIEMASGTGGTVNFR